MKPFGLNRNVFVAGLVSFLMDVSSEMIYPLVPMFLANVLGVNKSVIGLIEGIAEATASIVRIFSGWYSDALRGRKWLMAVGYGVSALSRPCVALATAWSQVFAFRFIDRLGKGIRAAPRDALIVESATRDSLGRAFGFHRAMDTFGAVVGPLFALVCLGIFANDYRRVFWLSLIPAIAAVVLIICCIRETAQPAGAGQRRPTLSLAHFDWRFKAFIGIATLFALGNSSDVFLILRAEQIGISSGMIPAVYLVFNLVYSLTSVPSGMIADRFGKKRLILLGFIFFAVVYFGFAVAAATWAIWLLFGLYGIFMGITEGVQRAFLATIIPEDAKATAFGIYNMCVGLALLPASLVAGTLWDRIDPSAPFYFGGITAILAALLFGMYAGKVPTEGRP